MAAGVSPIGRPRLVSPGVESHKYDRGKIVVLAGAMAGAAMLAATAAQRSGAGYVTLLGAEGSGPPHALVRERWTPEQLGDPRIAAVVVGPGLGTDESARSRLEAALACGHPLVIDADALTLLAEDGPERLRALGQPPVLTPHDGEFARLFGHPADRLNGARTAAAASGSIVLLKGSRSIVAHPDGRAAIADAASPWLATAGTGDVLAGIIGTMVAQAALHGFGRFEAAQAALWLHAEAARLAGPALIADDLVGRLPTALSACLA